jgi:amino acid transporter
MAQVEVSGSAGVEAFGYRQELKRALSLFDLLVYGLVFIAPIAPFGVFGFVFNASNGMVPLVYIVGLGAMLFTALSYVTMSRAFPVAGSVYAYAGRGIGENAGFLAGWAMLLDYLLIPTLAYVGCAVAMAAVLPGVPKPVWVIVFLAFNTGINLIGIEATARVNKLLLILQLILLAVFIVLGVIALRHGAAGAHLSLAPFWDTAKVTPGLIFGALSLAALSFLGFDAISTLSEEARGGSRTVGIATVSSLILAAVLFIGQTYLASLFVLGRTSFPPGDESANAFLTIASIVGGESFKVVVAVLGLVLALLAGALAAQAATARLLYSMARDGKLPRALAHVDVRRKAPQRAALLVAGITLVLGLAMVSQLQLLVSLVNFGALFGFLMLHLSVVIHFTWRGPSRRWIMHLVVPSIGFVVISYVLINADSMAKIAGSVWLTIGVAVLLTLKARGRRATLPAEDLG